MLKRIAVFWAKTDRNKKKFMSGTLDLGAMGEARVLMFPNSKKEADNAPDYYLYLASDDNGEAPEPGTSG